MAASIIISASGASSSVRRVLPSAFHQLPPATALLGRSYATAGTTATTNGGWHQQRQHQQQRFPIHARAGQAMAAAAAAASSRRLPSIRGGAMLGAGFFPFSSSSSSGLRGSGSGSNFGFPDAAEEAMAKTQSYLEAFVDEGAAATAGNGGRPVVRALPWCARK